MKVKKEPAVKVDYLKLQISDKRDKNGVVCAEWRPIALFDSPSAKDKLISKLLWEKNFKHKRGYGLCCQAEVQGRRYTLIMTLKPNDDKTDDKTGNA